MPELNPSRTSATQDSDQAFPARQRPLRKGDIRRIEPLLGLDSEPRTALIVRTDRNRYDYSEVMLTHTRIDMATADDVVVYPSHPAHQHGVVVQTHHRGMVWNLQISTLFGHLPADQMAAISRALQSRTLSGKSVSVERSVAEGSGTRVQFQDSELRALSALVGDCTDAILDEGPPWHIDAGLLSPRLLARSTTPERVLTEIMHIFRTREVTATSETLHLLQQSGFLKTETWAAANYGPGLASQISLSARSLVECALRESQVAEYDKGTTANRVKLPNRASGAGEIYVIPGDRLVTAPFLWTDGGDQLLAQSDHGGRGGIDNLEVMMLATTRVSGSRTECDHGA